MYFLLVCADLYGEKMNLEITFPTMPTIGELNRKVTEVFNAEAAIKRPQGYPAIDFTVARLQIYDDIVLKWTDLVACTQLHEYDQLYAFQPQSPWHIDVQKDLPPPRPPTQGTRGTGGSMVEVGTPSHLQQSSYSPAPHSSALYAPAGAASAPRGAANNGGSPQTVNKIEEQRRREQQLQMELQRVHEETARLEAQAAAEAEEERRRAAEEAERMLRQKEEEMRRQREALLRAEEEYRRLHEEAQFRHQGVNRYR